MLESREILLSWLKGVVEREKGVYPVGFKGKRWQEKVYNSWAGKLVECYSSLKVKVTGKECNTLALVATAQANQDSYYQTLKSQKSYAPSSKPLIPTRSHTTTKYIGKEIAKPITPPSELASEKDSDPEQAQRDKDMQKNLALIVNYFKRIYKPTNNNLRTSSNSRNKNVDTTPRYKNDNQSGQFEIQRTTNVVGARENECRKPKRVKDFAYHKEKMLLCKQAEKESDDERVALANLIANLKLDVDENKKIQKQLKKANTTLAQELKECKTILAETNKTLRESNSVWESCLVALQNKQTEFEKYNTFDDRVNHKTNVSRPQHRSNQIKDKFVPNNNQVKLKKTHVEDYPRIPSISNKIKFVSACNDSLNSRCFNVNDVCATCGKCLVDSDHFACVTKMLNDVNSRIKKHNVVPISTRKPKGHANKSVATPQEKVASKSTTQKPKSYYWMLYEKTSKAWKWWREQQCPSGYK
nr:hypothetical protein [Tanacetum cinerariifolium]